MDDFKTIQNAPMNELKGKSLKLALSRKIVNDAGLVGAFISGAHQTGKSSYALCVMYELYQGDIEEIFRHIVFTISDLTKLLNNAIKTRTRCKCILWDDSSVHGSASQYNVNRQLVAYLGAMSDTMGIATKSILLTSPSGDIVKTFRNYNFYRVQIGIGRHKYDRIARGYEFGSSPFGQQWGRASFEDSFDVRIPFYERYYKLREQMSLSTLQDMDAFLHRKTPLSDESHHEETEKDRILRVNTDWKNGEYGDVSRREALRKENIDIGYAENLLSRQKPH